MKYIEDFNFKYENLLIKHLRAYNLIHTGVRQSSKEYFYAFSGDKLVGAVYTELFWDWVSLKDMFYNNSDILSDLIAAVSNYYHDKAVGMKKYSDDIKRINDLKSVGFEIAGFTPRTPKTISYSYLRKTDLSSDHKTTYRVEVYHEKQDNYDEIFKKKLSENQKLKKTSEQSSTKVMFVALENNEFAGGVSGSITADSLYVGRLVVVENHRGKGIGKRLMGMIEERARDLGIYSINLGTIDFQAEKFYAMLGYEVVMVKENDPKGYNSYTMVKKL